MSQKPVKQTRAANSFSDSAVTDRKHGDPGDTRILIDQDGAVCFTGKTIQKTLGFQISKADRPSALDILDFEDSEQVFHDTGQALFGINSPQDLPFADTFQDGIHTVRTAKDITVDIFFNRIETDKGTFIVGSLVNGKAEESLSEELSGWISQTLPTNQDESSQNSFSDTDMRVFMEISDEILVCCNKNGTFRNVNQTFYNSLGYSEEQSSTLKFIDIIAPEDRASVRPFLMQVANGETAKGQVTNFEARVLRNDDSRRWVKWTQKKYGHHIYFVGRDLTQLKKQRESFERQKHQLSEAQAIGRMGHWIWNLNDHSVEWSDELYRIFGLTKDSFALNIDNVTKLIHRRDLGRAIQSFQRAMIDKKDFELELRIKQPEGETRYMRCQGRCKTENDGEVTALFGILQDITDRHEYETELMQAKDSAERAYATKSQFLANMSHELRTPLNAIIGFSEMIQQQLLGPIGTEKYLDYVSGIRESGEHLLDLITDILDMSKIEAGKYELNLEKIKIHDVLDMALHMIESRALDNNIKLKRTWTKDANSPLINVDRRAVMQIALNILSNAVKFSGENGKVTAECLQRDNYIVIKVTDTGIGIPANKINDILRPFEQVCNQYSRNHEGSGLGLAITKELVELHGGNLFLESTVGKGTTVTVRLPIDAEQTRRDILRNN